MMQDRATLTLGTLTLGTLTLGSRGLRAGWSFGVVCVLSAACAGGDTPETDDVLENQLAVAYAGRQPTAQAGSTGMGAAGTGGAGGGGSTPVVPSNGGSDSGTGGTASASGGTAGTGEVSSGGTAGTGSTAGGCDGFAILQAKCNGGSCHGDGSSFTNFAASETAAEGFAGEQSVICGSSDNAPIFNPDNPASSLVLKKIAGTATCGGQMPLGNPGSVSAEDVDCLEEWIGTL
jgi:hypothetical protein